MRLLSAATKKYAKSLDVRAIEHLSTKVDILVGLVCGGPQRRILFDLQRAHALSLSDSSHASEDMDSEEWQARRRTL